MDIELDTGVSHEVRPVDVRIVGAEKERSTEYSSFQTFYFTTGTTGPAFAAQLIPQNRNRDRAILRINATDSLGVVNAGYVRIGSRAQVQAIQGVNGSSGAVLQMGSQLTLESSGEVWIAGYPVTDIIIVIVDELYMSDGS